MTYTTDELREIHAYEHLRDNATTYAYDRYGKLYMGSEHKHPDRHEPDDWRLIAAWPGGPENMPPSIRPTIERMYREPTPLGG